MTALEGRGLVDGRAEGTVLALGRPLSFWGGVSLETGIIQDAEQAEVGQSIAGRILAMPSGRGSSSASSVLAELLRTGMGPAAIVTATIEPIQISGSLVARQLYGIVCPMGVLPADVLATLTTGMQAYVSVDDGRLLIEIR